MRQEDRQAKLIEWFERAAVAHASAMELMNETMAAREVERLDRVFAAVKREGGLERFLVLLDNPDPAVCGMAAVYAMRDAPHRCRAVLVMLSKKPGLLGFRASVALEMWDSGTWPH